MTRKTGPRTPRARPAPPSRQPKDAQLRRAKREAKRPRPPSEDDLRLHDLEQTMVAAFPLQKMQNGPRALKIRQALLQVYERTAELRRLLRPDGEPRLTLRAGALGNLLLRPDQRSSDEIWHSAVTLAVRVLHNPRRAKDVTELAAMIGRLADRGFVRKTDVRRAAALRPELSRRDRACALYVRLHVLGIARSKRRRSREHAMQWLSDFTGTSLNTIREACEHAETGREWAPLGTTLAHRKRVVRDLKKAKKSLQEEREAARKRGMKRS